MKREIRDAERHDRLADAVQRPGDETRARDRHHRRDVHAHRNDEPRPRGQRAGRASRFPRSAARSIANAIQCVNNTNPARTAANSAPPVTDASARPAADRNAALSKPTRRQWRIASDAISRTSAKKIGMRIESQIGPMKSTPPGCYRAGSPPGKGTPPAWMRGPPAPPDARAPPRRPSRNETLLVRILVSLVRLVWYLSLRPWSFRCRSSRS